VVLALPARDFLLQVFDGPLLGGGNGKKEQQGQEHGSII